MPLFNSGDYIQFDQWKVAKAADLHAQAWNSDPFARARITNLMKRGFEFPSDVEADALNMLAARGVAKSV